MQLDWKSMPEYGQTVYQFPLKEEWENGVKSCGKSLDESGQTDLSNSSVSRAVSYTHLDVYKRQVL